MIDNISATPEVSNNVRPRLGDLHTLIISLLAPLTSDNGGNLWWCRQNAIWQDVQLKCDSIQELNEKLLLS